MTIDRYTKAVLTVIAVALVVIAVRPYFSGSAVTSALQVAPAQAQTSAVREATIPKAWGGNYIGYGGGHPLPEGPDKTFPVLDLDRQPPEVSQLAWRV